MVEREARSLLRTSFVAALLSAAVLAGCASPSPHGDELYRSAREANLQFKETVAGVLRHLSNASWQVQEYGDSPLDCADGYGFSLHRTTYEGWMLRTDALTTAEEAGAWLAARGWTTSAPTVAGGGAVVEASDPSRSIAALVIEVHDGEGTADAIGVGATSGCFEGDAEELKALLYPGYPDRPSVHEPLPLVEQPDDAPVFGFTPDGRPR